MHLFRRKNNKNFTTFELWFGMAIHVLYFLLNQFLLLYVKTWKGVVMRSQLMNDNIIIQIRIKFFSSNKSIFVGIHVWKPGWWGFKVLIHTKVVQGLFQVNFQITIGINCIEIQCSLQKKNVIKWARPKALLSIRDNVAYFKTQFILIRSISSWSVSAFGTSTCTTGTSVSFAACTCTTGTSFSAAATFSIPCHHGKEYQSQNRLHLQKRKKKNDQLFSRSKVKPTIV